MLAKNNSCQAEKCDSHFTFLSLYFFLFFWSIFFMLVASNKQWGGRKSCVCAFLLLRSRKEFHRIYFPFVTMSRKEEAIARISFLFNYHLFSCLHRLRLSQSLSVPSQFQLLWYHHFPFVWIKSWEILLAHCEFNYVCLPSEENSGENLLKSKFSIRAFYIPWNM